MVREEITGTGHLVSRQDSFQRWHVFYYFEVDKRIKDGKTTRHHSRGIVRCEKGTVIPEGEYDLHTADEALTVVNLGLGGWAILASA